MAKTKKRKRPAFPLTLAANHASTEAFILGALSARVPGNSPGRLPGELPPKWPGMLPDPESRELGRPLDIKQVADMIGCSPWTVRRTLLPKGLPYFRSAASSKLIFYEFQVVGWIAKQQKIKGGIPR